ncbi:uncharacterized protein CTRU02_213734 [Colletotrichum truncatum]|uniref:Uncharacterized protein n=1 Tax=Colletotrichum truncatum TaxID=5467 RepID=A0ACC3YGK0_COLTU|nr:uncharacterized protein CTRU02_15056 [Colletotrichum truncatum]KAF6781480.1 hypothetical protein CTRU02_15056 [Colletotrichum truncatum]
MAGEASSSSPPTSLDCPQPDCTSSTFSNKSNLTRHIKYKHGPKARMACGKEIKNQTSNIKRHEDKCEECKKRKNQPGATQPLAEHDGNRGSSVSHGVLSQGEEALVLDDGLFGGEQDVLFDPSLWEDEDPFRQQQGGAGFDTLM